MVKKIKKYIFFFFALLDLTSDDPMILLYVLCCDFYRKFTGYDVPFFYLNDIPKTRCCKNDL